ncbi:MAG TPA: hypothetical protein VKF14_03425 [Candidatus Dormibacteraeota bacterium]|nr:hypothetical protein [Candidatus Dormibacteraeota bacterium]
MKPSEAFAIVRRVATVREPPIWLICGVGVAFMAGRWTRDHHDVDFMTFAEHRATAIERFERLGFSFESDHGWVTHWRSDVHLVELVFVDRTGPDSGDVVVCPQGSFGGTITVGRHPGLAGDMDVGRFASLDGVRIRVSSAAGEWALRRGYASFKPEAAPLPAKVANDLVLLEAIVTPRERALAEKATGLVLPLRPGDCS